MGEAPHGVPKNDNEAAYWDEKAAEQGDPDAQLRFGKRCLASRSEPQSKCRGIALV
jgi:TPR repeat protein